MPWTPGYYSGDDEMIHLPARLASQVARIGAAALRNITGKSVGPGFRFMLDDETVGTFVAEISREEFIRRAAAAGFNTADQWPPGGVAGFRFFTISTD